MVQDAVADITIQTFTSAFAHIDAIRQLDTSTNTWYSLFPSQVRSLKLRNFHLQVKKDDIALQLLAFVQL